MNANRWKRLKIGAQVVHERDRLSPAWTVTERLSDGSVVLTRTIVARDAGQWAAAKLPVKIRD